jgi:DNA-binding MarR family transcriptional regulator
MPGFAIVETFRALRHAMDDALREFDLTTPQFGVMACLGHSGGLCGADMARIHHLTPQTMNTIIQNMERRGLIERSPDPSGGKQLHARLTPRGHELLDRAMERSMAVQERLLSPLDQEERRTLVALLNRCSTAMEREAGLELASV